MPKGILLAMAATAALVAGALAITAQPNRSIASATLDAEEQSFVSLISQYRQQNGLNSLAIDTRLQDAAAWMSTDMGVHNYFSHADSLGRDPFQRMNAFGYNYNTWRGENIAAGTSSAQVAFDLWKNSPGHNANMLNPNYKVMGIDRDDTPGSGYGWYWTNDFGGYQVPSTPAPTPSPSASPAPNSDADGDGFTFAVETHVGTNTNDTCGNPDTSLPGSPSRAWPADLSIASPNQVDILDLATFVAPVRRFNTSTGDPGYDRRWDIAPGGGSLGKEINIMDVSAIVTARASMFGSQRVFNGPACTP
jgi:uncharacterized protein YkwD